MDDKILWKPVPGYEGYYEVSNTGLVRSVDRAIVKSNGVTQHRSGRMCRLATDVYGYLVVKLSRDGISKYVAVSRIVFSAFNDTDISDMDIDHIDFDRKNNNLDNLRAVSHLDNVRHTKAHGRHVSDRGFDGEKNPNYGNRKLSERYRVDKSLAVLKQGRPGCMNGRSRRVRLVLDGEQIDFGYMSECAKYLISHNLVRSKNSVSVATYIRKAAESGKKYCGMTFMLI